VFQFLPDAIVGLFKSGIPQFTTNGTEIIFGFDFQGPKRIIVQNDFNGANNIDSIYSQQNQTWEAFASPKTVWWEENSEHIIKTKDKAINYSSSYYKFRNWNNDEQIKTIQKNTLADNDKYESAYFKNVQPLTVQTNLIEGGTGGSILYEGLSKSSPLNDYGFVAPLSTTIGVQNPQLINGKNYYLFNWQDGNSEPNRNISLTSAATYTANLKGSQLSNSQNAITNPSQRKFVRGSNGYLHFVYESIGKIWYELSTDNGITWQIANNGNPLSFSYGKSPSIDYSNDSKIGIVWQEENEGAYSIKIAVFSLGGLLLMNGKTSVHDEIYLPYTNNANPIISWGGDGRFIVAWERQDDSFQSGYTHGILCKYGSHSVMGFSWLDDKTLSPIITDYATNPTLAVNKNNGNSYHLAWQQGTTTSSIKYCRLDIVNSQLVLTSIDTPSNGSGYTKNYQPSMVVLADNIPRLTWVGESSSSNKRAILRGKTNAGIWNTQFFYWDTYVNSVSINSCSPSTSPNLPVGGYVLCWNRNSTSPYTNKYIRNTNYINTISFGIAGKDLQVNNSNNAFNDFYGMSISTESTAPYNFIKSASVSSLGKETVEKLNTGRKIVLSKDGIEYYYTVGSIKVDGQDVRFYGTKESDLGMEDDYFDISNPDNYFQTEPFVLNSNSSFEFKIDYGTTMPDKVGGQLKRGDKINIGLELIDDKTGDVIGKFKEAAFNKDLIPNLDATKMVLNTSGIKSKTVKLRFKVDENINSMYTICDYYIPVDESLPKENVIEMNYAGELAVKDYGLSQNFPNPFNPTTVINYQLPKAGNVTLKVYDALGKLVRTLVDEYKSEGRHSVEFSANSNIASGMYFYELRSGEFVSTKKMMFVK